MQVYRGSSQLGRARHVMRRSSRAFGTSASSAARSEGASSASQSRPAPKLPAFDHQPRPYTGPSAEEVLKLRKDYLNPALLMYYKKPVLTVEGKMQYLYDEKGRRYLDLFAGIVTISVGHSHPEVVKAGTEQLQTLNHTTNIYLNHQHSLFGKELAAKLPSHINKIYFVNSGSEANDLATLMARLYTGNFDIIALRNGYHGMTTGTMNLTSLSTWRYPLANGIGIRHAQFPDTYRGVWGRDDPDAGKKYARDVQEIIQFDTPGKVAAFIAEPIQGVGGAVPLPPGYLQEVYKYVKSAGGVCISDEVQTGFGRLGSHYWGFQAHGVTPDIVTMAKGIGNGAPLAAVATTTEIAQTLAQKATFNTYGGNPVSCAMGRATLRVIDQEKLQQNSLEVGNYLKQKLLQLQAKHSIVGDVRGDGLILGMELVKDRKTKVPAVEETARVFERTKELGLLVGKGGYYGTSFRIKPPMCITKQDADFAYEVFDIALSEL